MLPHDKTVTKSGIFQKIGFAFWETELHAVSKDSCHR